MFRFAFYKNFPNARWKIDFRGKKKAEVQLVIYYSNPSKKW